MTATSRIWCEFSGPLHKFADVFMPQKAGTDTIFKLPKIESVPVFCFVYYTWPYLWIRVLSVVQVKVLNS